MVRTYTLRKLTGSTDVTAVILTRTLSSAMVAGRGGVSIKFAVAAAIRRHPSSHCAPDRNHLDRRHVLHRQTTTKLVLPPAGGIGFDQQRPNDLLDPTRRIGSGVHPHSSMRRRKVVSLAHMANRMAAAC